MNQDIRKKITLRDDSITYKFLSKLKLEAGENPNIFRKAIVFSLITWLPLLILTSLQGNAINPSLKISFLHDYVTYTRFLISLPLLFFAEKFINFEIGNSVFHFVESGIISDNNISDYEKIIKRFNKLLNSKISEIIIFISAIVQIYLTRLFFENFGETSSWEFISGERGSRTLAGYWYVLVSLPILQFLIFRMLWKFILWTWFLWKLSGLNLNLVASDPDKAAGLAFLGTAQLSFGFLALAQSTSFSAEIANKVIFGEVPIEDFKFTVLISLISVLVFYLFPLFFFIKKLTKIKLQGLLEYGVLTHKYSYSFNEKWIKGNNPENEPLLGTGDIQSLADIGGSYERITDMKIVPLNFRIVLMMFILVALPLLPLLTLKIPLSEILKSIAGFLF